MQQLQFPFLPIPIPSGWPLENANPEFAFSMQTFNVYLKSTSTYSFTEAVFVTKPTACQLLYTNAQATAGLVTYVCRCFSAVKKLLVTAHCMQR